MAAEQGHAEAQCKLGLCLVEGIGCEKNLEEAIEWFHKIPERGDAEAQNNLGSCQDNGIGCEKNPEEAVK